jgi:hypothetical protein
MHAVNLHRYICMLQNTTNRTVSLSLYITHSYPPSASDIAQQQNHLPAKSLTLSPMPHEYVDGDVKWWICCDCAGQIERKLGSDCNTVGCEHKCCEECGNVGSDVSPNVPGFRFVPWPPERKSTTRSRFGCCVTM